MYCRLVKCYKLFGLWGSLHEEDKVSRLVQSGNQPKYYTVPERKPVFQRETTRIMLAFYGLHSKGLQCQGGVSAEMREIL